ncbi:hypothetical protein [Mycoplasmopsis cynos]|uniref:hypothetical protein n=1 Tax=Mycoplasmopsis cynos TaxID=171284 RepID=UPI002AFFDFE6|nr:hypothetical protein [Mycoplasmopsis cynos]WQQ14478.1 hypothetical protein RRG42_02615 [Mycoplasmopsis cynos]WQQ14721.1 hypothetical protein RRG42_00010 [Mycoplasmopsis cynos]
MNKYKKIFSGLGLLSISTLIGASVVACAKTKVEKEETPAPGTSDSKDLATIKNEALAEVEKLQGHKKYTELKAIIDKENATIEELNSAKTSAIEELNKYKEEVQTAIEAIIDNTKKEELKKEIETANSYNDLKTIKDKIESKPSPENKPKNDGKDNPNKKPGETDSSNQGKNEDSTSKDNNGKTEPEKGKENEGKDTTPKDGKEQMPPKVMTVDEKVQKLNSLVVEIPFPDPNTPTKQYLKSKVEEIKNKQISDNDKLNELTMLETTFKEYKMKVEKYKGIIDNTKFKSSKYGSLQINGLNGRLSKLFGDDPKGKYTESELIWQIYETFRRSAFVKSKNFTPKIYEYVIVDDSEKNKHSTMFEALADDKKKNHNIDITQLEQKINNIVNFTIEIAKKAANKNIDKIKYTNTASDTEKPDMLIEKLKSFVTTTTNLADIDILINKIKQIVSKVQEVVTSGTKNKDDKIKDKINKIDANNVDEVITKLGKLKPASSAPSKAN